jgi:hypothetical protein
LPATQKEVAIVIVKEEEQKNLLTAFDIPY